VLREVGVQPLRGELDDAFAKAMDYYWSGHYSAALGLLRKVDDLQDGHPLARKYLRQAQTKAGGSDDIPVSTPSPTAPEGLDAAFWGLVALGILVAIALALLAIGWRRRRAASGPAYAPISPNGDGRPEGEVPENAQAGRTG